MYGCCNLCDIIRWYALKRNIHIQVYIPQHPRHCFMVLLPMHASILQQK